MRLIMDGRLGKVITSWITGTRLRVVIREYVQDIPCFGCLHPRGLLKMQFLEAGLSGS
jgi:hypothetical protein